MTQLGQRSFLAVLPRDHISGSVHAPLTLIEYGDYECIHCARAHQTVTAIERSMGEHSCFVFRHFPLVSVHPHALLAAEAAESAASRANFWAMHAALFEQNAQLSRAIVLSCAKAVGLDHVQLAYDLGERVHETRVREDLMSGVRSGVNGTPTFFINGKRHDGGHDYAALEYALQLSLPKIARR
jgi:protein-disulfide isomerase